MSLKDMLPQGFDEMHQKLMDADKMLKNIEVDGSSGGGAVLVRMNCRGYVSKIFITDEAFEEKGILSDLIIAAVNKARENADEKYASEVAKLGLG